ncbi:MAG: TolC family protein [Deltaproteobacteria bacterium]|nr:TolC family protein [Deltaproteobacteria bacterium]
MGKRTQYHIILSAIILCVALLQGCIILSPSLGDHRAVNDDGSALNDINLVKTQGLSSPGNLIKSYPPLKGPLSLDEAVSMALLRNQRIRIALRNEGIADDALAQVFSQYYPFIEINGGFTSRDNDPGLSDPKSGRIQISGEREVFSGSIFANYLLTDFGGRYFRLKGAQLDAAIARIVSLDEYRNVTYEVTESYFNLLKARHFYDVAEGSNRLFAKQLQVSRDLYDNEIVAKNDVLSAEIGLANAQQALVTAKNNIAITKAILNYILDLDIDHPTEIEDVTAPPDVSLDYRRLLLLAIDRRPELMRLRSEKNKAEAVLKATIAEFAPSIVASAGYRTTSDEYPLNKDYVSAGIFFKWDIIKGGKIPARIRQARRFVEQVEDRIALQDSAVALDVKTAFLRVDENRKNITVAEKAALQSEENLRIFQDQYHYNIVSITDVLAAQSSLIRSQFNYYTTLYDYHLSLSRLESAIGTRIFSKAGNGEKEK